MLTIRPATIDDVPLLRKFIYELAEFEKEPDQVRITEAELARVGFGPAPKFRALVAEWSGEAAGFALFFDYFSTWRGLGLHLEDLFVRPEFRGRGIGKALLAQIARIAEQENRVLIRWEVLDWNQPAIDFYNSLGADLLEDWRPFLLEGEALRKLAAENS